MVASMGQHRPHAPDLPVVFTTDRLPHAGASVSLLPIPTRTTEARGV